MGTIAGHWRRVVAIAAIATLSASTLSASVGVAAAPVRSSTSTPLRSATDDMLLSVACAGQAMCMAVGGDGVDFNPLALAERWNGTNWTVVPTPNPPGTLGSALFGVACPTTQWCAAVGFYGTRKVFGPLVERWNGTAWSVVPSPNPGGQNPPELLSVSCSSTTACTAVGCFFSGNFGCLGSIAERWDGIRWVVQPTPGAGQALTGVACSTASSCMAVGYGGGSVLTERWNGTAWTILPTPLPRGSRGGEFQGVACATSAACTAVGDYLNNLGGVIPLAEGWNGTRWAVENAAIPSGSQIGLVGVGCSAAAACTAIGNYQTGTGTTLILAERWNGATWTIQHTPNPRGTIVDGLFGVFCSAGNACTAVGSNIFDHQGDTVTLAERWNGSAWTIQPTTSRASAG